MAQVITLAGEKLFATKAQANQQLDIDTFIFANVTGQDPAAAIDRNEGIPTNAVVHQQNVQQTGRINDNVVVYSTVLDSVTGPFEFNWVGLYSSVNQTLVAISHVPTVAKTITAPGSAGNTLNRNFGIEYSGIADLAGISVSPQTWQLDFTARLSGMDELTRQLASDMNGKDWFIDDGFKVVPRSTANTFSVTPGIGYVSGLRVELKQEQILTIQTYPQFVYVDAYFDGDAYSVWSPKCNFFISSEDAIDYIDSNGRKHYLVKLSIIESYDNVLDVRNKSKFQESLNNNIDTIAKGIRAAAGLLKTNNRQVVITGDSLSYNYQDFDDVPRNNAVDCYPGMNSWSFMLRDLMMRSDPSFELIEDMVDIGNLTIKGESSTLKFNQAPQSQMFPFNGRVATFRGNINDDISPEIRMEVQNTGDSDYVYILQLMAPTVSNLNANCKLSVDGVIVYNSLTNKSIGQKFRGFEIRQIEVPIPNDGALHEVRLHEFSQASEEPEQNGNILYNLIGCTSKRTNVELSGTGGYTSSQLLSQWANKVTNYNPDLVICIVGANDAYKNTNIDVFKENIREMSRLAKVSNDGCQILWLSTPYSNEELVTNVVAQKYVNALREVAISIEDSFINIVEFFKDVPPELYRFDNIHWNKAGNQMLSQYIASVLGFEEGKEGLKSSYSLILGQDTPNTKIVKNSTIKLAGAPNSSNKKFSIEKVMGLGNEVLSAEGIFPAVIEITMRRKLKHYKDIRIAKVDYVNKTYLTPITSMEPENNKLRFAVINPDGSKISDTEWDLSSGIDMRFTVSYS
ncbi:phage tail protein [Pseudoalteromonas sp. SiA1]|uniref:phage tail-collar fiber domain-containing protein n=1 Tax=Pseudoalteromonas sp. SiA1 TaxID=2839744 RepID=UPI001C003FD2|nr:phage tail protein [Pseudoalteromonas sp. SiA1]QWF33766.1 phage tail protein [Pseudoalteromonas sp. SiA1]